MTALVSPGNAASTGAADNLDIVDPRDGSALASYRVGTRDDIDRTVAAARAGALWWHELGYSGRRARLDRWRRIITSRLDQLADVVVAETGKTPADAKAEVVIGLAHLHWAAKHAERKLRTRRRLPGMLMSNHVASVQYEPMGVVGVIGPWNYPVFTPMGSIAYALAAGNAVIFKPSEHTSGVGKWLSETFLEAVGDPRVFCVVTGDGSTGAALCEAAIDKLAFTGSAATGRRVMTACAANLTPVVMECGGKDALIVDTDADLRLAAEAAVWGAMANAGQACMAVERVYVVAGVVEGFVKHVKDRCAVLHSGPEVDADYGPMTVPSQVEVVSRHIGAAIADGGTPIVGGPRSVRRPYVSPVVIMDVPETSAAMVEETFGPVLIINTVSSVDEAIERTNASAMGLGASVFGRKDVARIVARLHVGMVSVNSVLPMVAIPSVPFGGTGESGFGRIHGEEGLKEFARTKTVARQLFKPPLRVLSFDRPSWTTTVLLRLARLLYGR